MFHRPEMHIHESFGNWIMTHLADKFTTKYTPADLFVQYLVQDGI